MSYIISTDSGANLPMNIIEDNQLIVVPLTYRYNNQEYQTVDLNEFDGKSYYDMIKKVDVTTSTVNIQQFCDAWEPFLKEGKDILHVSMSSGISSSYQASHMAMEMLNETYPERVICTIDTYAASLGEGLNVLDAVKYREEGIDIIEAASLLEKKRSQMRQVFTVDDLNFLKKGGRLSGAAALIGSILSIKPILIGNEIGQIVLKSKERGRKAAMKALLNEYKEMIADPKNSLVCIAHADATEDTEWLVDAIHSVHPEQKILTEIYEPVTGCHVGTGTVALFFWKKVA